VPEKISHLLITTQAAAAAAGADLRITPRLRDPGALGLRQTLVGPLLRLLGRVLLPARRAIEIIGWNTRPLRAMKGRDRLLLVPLLGGCPIIGVRAGMDVEVVNRVIGAGMGCHRLVDDGTLNDLENVPRQKIDVHARLTN